MTDRFTTELQANAEPDWTAATTHEFTRELASGTLDEERYARYLRQDYAFLGSLADLVGYAAAQAPTFAAKTELAGFLCTLAGPENDYFQRTFDELDVPETQWRTPERDPVTRAFDDLLGHAASVGGYAETLAVLLAVEWVYLTWARTVEESPPQWYYREWIAIHATDEFASFVDWLREQLDQEGPTLSARRKTRVTELFDRAVALEVRFFEETPAPR